MKTTPEDQLLKFSKTMRVGAVALIIGAAGLSMNAGASAASTPSANELSPVDIVAVSGLLDDVVVAEIEAAIDRSTTNGAQAIVLQVNSRGAVVSRERMAEVLEKISSAAIPVAVWVGPTGARAYGLSAQMLTVADVTAMAPGARIGFSGDLLSIGGTPVSFGSVDAQLKSSSVGFSDARKLGVLKNVGTDEGVPVVRNMLFALDGLTIDGKSLDTVVESLDSTGLVVRDATTARFFKLGTVGQLMHTVASPPVAYLLFAIGLSLLIFEFFTAGIGIAGFVGAVCLVLGVYGLAALPVHLWAVALIVLSVFAFAVDVQVGVPRLWTGIGLGLFTIASLTLYQPVDGSTMRMSWFTLVCGIAMMALAFIVGMPSMVRTRFATPTIGREWMIGMEGVAQSDISPEGIVIVQSAQWHARTNRSTPLLQGAAFRVAAIDGITLEVEPLEGAARDYREMRKPVNE